MSGFPSDGNLSMSVGSELAHNQCVYLYGWREYRSSGYTKQHSSPLVGTLRNAYLRTRATSSLYLCPVVLNQSQDLSGFFLYIFYFKGKSYFVYGTSREIQGSCWLAAMYVVFGKVPLMAFE